MHVKQIQLTLIRLQFNLNSDCVLKQNIKVINDWWVREEQADDMKQDEEGEEENWNERMSERSDLDLCRRETS